MAKQLGWPAQLLLPARLGHRSWASLCFSLFLSLRLSVSLSLTGWVTGPGPWSLRGVTLSLPSGMGGAAAIHIPPGSVGCQVDRVTVHSWGPHLGAGVGIGFVKAPTAAKDRERQRETEGDREAPLKPTSGRWLGASDGGAAEQRRVRLAQPNNAPVARHWSVTGAYSV